MAFTASQKTRPRSLHLSLRTKLLLPLVFVIAGLTGATLLVVRHSTETQAQAQIEQEARNAILTIQAALNQRELILSKKADLLAMVAYMRNGDSHAIDDDSDGTWQSNDCDLFAISDAKGKVLSVHSTAVGFSSANAKELIGHSLKANRLVGIPWPDFSDCPETLLRRRRSPGYGRRRSGIQ
jgi:hypothetical protein